VRRAGGRYRAESERAVGGLFGRKEGGSERARVRERVSERRERIED
jgi:hypothetical protein